MKSYLSAKLILFREILIKKSTIITDKQIKPFSIIKRIALKRNLKIVDIGSSFRKIKDTLLNFTSDFKIRNLSMAIEAAKLCNLNR